MPFEAGPILPSEGLYNIPRQAGRQFALDPTNGYDVV